MTSSEVPVFEAVRYSWRDWYTRVTYPDGRTLHSEPWKSHWAANHLAGLWKQTWARMVRRSDGAGNADTCPLFPDHGAMMTIPNSNPPRQYCPHRIHDGLPPTAPNGGVPPSRAFWPLFGFEESRDAYMARLDRAIREAGPDDLPDLSTLEVD